MMNKRVLTFAILALLAVPFASAHAGWRVGIGIGFRQLGPSTEQLEHLQPPLVPQ